MDIAILTWQKYHGRMPGSIGSSVIRGEWILNHWPEAKLWENGMKSDVIIYQKTYWPEHMRDFSGLKIFDVCDPEWLDGKIELKTIEKYCDAITCATDALRDSIKNVIHTIPVVTIPDRIDTDQFPKTPKRHTERAKTVVWFGYQHNGNQVLPQIIPTIAQYNIELIIVSNGRFAGYDMQNIPITFVQWQPDTAYHMIRQADFAINPKLPTFPFQYKSNNKTLIAWALGLPCAETLDEFHSFMDPNERIKEIKKRSEEIEQKWHIRYSVEEYKKLIEKIYDKKKSI